MTFDELIARCKQCNACNLRKTATQAVPGEGSIPAEMMFIGEGPGASEDKEGVPFCGAAGKFLDELLESIGIRRAEVYITNMVKCRPPGNRDPQDDEIAACRGWLDAQIKFVKPKVFVLLGRFAMGKFFPALKISQVHGKAYAQKGQVYFILYHPAVALYNASFRDVFFEDMKKLKEILDGDTDAIEYLDASPVSEIQKILKEKRAVEKKEKPRQLKIGF